MNFLKKFTFKKIDKLLAIAFVGLGLAAFVMDWNSKKDSVAADTPKETAQVDTMIPAGYLLIPIQLTNGESLASLSGDFALIDLYSVREKGRKGFKVASGVKLLKAPLNPEQFAVLMKEEESASLVQMEGPFFAALKNPADRARPALIKAFKNPLTIHYGE
jgi:hypothetical protein